MTLCVTISPVSIIEGMSAKPHCFVFVVSVVSTVVVHAPTSIVWEAATVMLGAMRLSISLFEHCSVIWAVWLAVGVVSMVGWAPFMPVSVWMSVKFSTVPVGNLNFVMLNSVQGLRLNVMEELIVFMFDVFSKLLSMVKLNVSWVVITSVTIGMADW